MRALVQRVERAEVRVGGEPVASIGAGLLVLLGVCATDDTRRAERLADKLVHLRIFQNDAGKFDASVLDVGGAMLVVSQFTLYADTRKGRRPSFTDAAPPALAETLYLYFAERVRSRGVSVALGRFGAHMRVELVNDGPVTLMLDS